MCLLRKHMLTFRTGYIACLCRNLLLQYAEDAFTAAGVTTTIVHPAPNDDTNEEVFPNKAVDFAQQSIALHVKNACNHCNSNNSSNSNNNNNCKLDDSILRTVSVVEMLDQVGKYQTGNSSFIKAASISLVDAGNDIVAANELVRYLLPIALKVGDHVNTASRSSLLLGVMAVSSGQWSRLNRCMERSHNDASKREPNSAEPVMPKFIQPVQSSEVGRTDHHFAALESERTSIDVAQGDARRRLTPVGFVTWAGGGVTRVDAVRCFAGLQTGGEGHLLLSQVLAEVVTKVGLRPKFGA